MDKQVKNLAFIDDDPSVLNIVKLTLEKSGIYSVSTYESTNEFLEAALDSSLHGILLDMNMPVMDGLESFAVIRKIPQLNNVSIAFLTAETSTDKLDAYMEVGAVATITKPIDVNSLVHQVAYIFGDEVHS